MPGGNRTGPDGTGPMTGRAAGFCAGNDAPGSMNASKSGRGTNRRRRTRGGRRRSQGSITPTSSTKQQQINDLKSQADLLEDSLGVLQEKIATLQRTED